ncbi:hypothetical protein HGA91_03410 [candidate division WWE3 bacterium]|nr:hypothetical protein [candidate division WWE3 bacterium]
MATKTSNYLQTFGFAFVAIMGLALLCISLFSQYIVTPISENVSASSSQSSATQDVPITTHTWYSSLMYSNYSEPLYALPVTYKLTSLGIEVGAPRLDETEKTVFYTHNPSLFIGFESNETITGKEVTHAGEWDVSFTLTNQKQKHMEITITKGDPTLVVRNNDSAIQISGSIHSIDQLSPQTYLLNTITGRQFLLISSVDTQVNASILTVTIPAGTETTQLILLPDNVGVVDRSSTLVQQVVGCSRNYQPGMTAYDVNLNATDHTYSVSYYRNSSSLDKQLMTIWPHQRSADSTILERYQSLGSYKTDRGVLDLVCTGKLTFTIKQSQLPHAWSDVLSLDGDKLDTAKALFNQDLQTFNALTVPTGVYFKGIYLKNLADLVELSHLLGLTTTFEDLKKREVALLMSEIDSFSVDDTTSLVVHKSPEFGNEKGNDHHFQYSYYIYAYSQMYEYFSETQKISVDALIRMFEKEGVPGLIDSSLYSRSNRFFDPIEYHSWADAQALFADGNNQESSSEALFYWYSWYLWGEKSNQSNIKELASYLYSAELLGRNTYWFFDGINYPNDRYTAPIASIIWGGKFDYATWFSAQDDKILGIQLLPLSPSSAVSLKFSETKLSALRSYFEPKFAQNAGTGFINYFEYVKKINHVGGELLPDQRDSEYIPRTFYYLWK